MPPRAARQVLQSTLQRVNVPSFIGDADGRILWLNNAAKDAFGDRAGDLYTTVVAPEDVERVAAEINRMRSGATGRDYEIDVILRDGRRRHVEVSSVPIEGNAVFHGFRRRSAAGCSSFGTCRIAPDATATGSTRTARQRPVDKGNRSVVAPKPRNHPQLCP
jgi:PAS domain S-box-containing protein